MKFVFLFQILDEANEEAAYNQHRELGRSALEGPQLEVKKKKRKHRYRIRMQLWTGYFLKIIQLLINKYN